MPKSWLEFVARSWADPELQSSHHLRVVYPRSLLCYFHSTTEQKRQLLHLSLLAVPLQLCALRLAPLQLAKNPQGWSEHAPRKWRVWGNPFWKFSGTEVSSPQLWSVQEVAEFLQNHSGTRRLFEALENKIKSPLNLQSRTIVCEKSRAVLPQFDPQIRELAGEMHPKNKGMGVQISPNSCLKKRNCMKSVVYLYTYACMYVCMYIYIYKTYIYIHTYLYDKCLGYLPRTATKTGNDQVISHPVPLTSMKSANKKRSRLEGVAAAHVILQAFQEIFLGAIEWNIGDIDGYQSWMDWF